MRERETVRSELIKTVHIHRYVASTSFKLSGFSILCLDTGTVVIRSTVYDMMRSHFTKQGMLWTSIHCVPYFLQLY